MAIFKDMQAWRFCRHLLTALFSCVGGLSSIMQICNVIYPGSHAIEDFGVLIAVIMASVSAALFKALPRPIAKEYNAPKTRITVVPGDLL